MKRSFVLLVALGACTSKSDHAREAVEFKQSRDSLLTTEVVRALQPAGSVGRVIYDHPAALSYDSLRVKRPDLLRYSDRPKPKN